MLADWIRNTTTTTGTGALTLAAVTGYPGFGDVFRVTATALAEPIPYAILDDATGAPIELGLGEYTAANTLSRYRVIWTYVSGTLSKVAPVAVTLAAGTKRVVCPMTSFGARLMPLMGVSTNVATVDIWDACAAMTGSAVSTVVPGADNIRAELFAISTPVALSHFLSHVTTAVALGECVMGLYSAGKGVASGISSALIAQSGVIDCSTTGLKASAVAGGSIWVPPGEYYVARWNKTATNAFQVYTSYSLGPREFVHGFGPARLYTRTSAYSQTMPASLESLGALTQATPASRLEHLLRVVKP